MSAARHARALRLFPWFSALAMTPFFVPVIVLFWEDAGLSTGEVFLLQGLFAGAMALLEVPTGVVADRLGKRTSLVLGQLVVCLGFVAYGFSASFWTFALVELAIALGLTLLSGADDALLFDLLEATGQGDRYTEHAGRNTTFRLVSYALCNVAGGLLAEAVSLRATLWASAAGPALAMILALWLADASPPRRARPGQSELSEALALTRDAARFVWRQQLVRWYAAFFAVLTGSAAWLLWLYQPFMSHVGLPLWSFGLLFALYNLTAAATGRLSHRVEARLGREGSLVFLGLLQVAPPLLMGALVGPVAVLFVLGHQAVRGMARPILSGRILAHTRVDKRATVLSLSSLSSRLFFALTAPLMAVVGDRLELPGTMLVQGGLLVLILGLLAVAWTRVPEKYHRVKPAPPAG